MKRFLLILLCAMLVCGAARAEDAAVQPMMDDGELHLDFSVLQPDNPVATPVAVDPIDKPTPTPAPTPNFIYDTYTNDAMGVSFSIPYTWLLNPNTNHATTVQFVEPKREMMDPDGYQTRITVEKINMGLSQTASDAKSQLETTLDELAASFTSFTPGNIDSGNFGGANGYYCYYKAEYNDGMKNYEMNGRIIMVAHEKALYQIRLTTPRNWYSYYNYLWRTMRNSIEYLD